MSKFFKNASPAKYTGEYSVIMAAEIIDENGSLKPCINWEAAEGIPGNLEPIHTQAGVRYWGRL